MNRIFTLEGPNGFCELLAEEDNCELLKSGSTITLYFEPDGGKPRKLYEWDISDDVAFENEVDEAFQGAKDYCGLGGWIITWFDIRANQFIDDWNEWNDFISNLK